MTQAILICYDGSSEADRAIAAAAALLGPAPCSGADRVPVTT